MRRPPLRSPWPLVVALTLSAGCSDAPAPGSPASTTPVPHPAARAVARDDAPSAGPGSFAPRLASLGDRVVLSWVEPGGPALRFAVREGGAWSAPRTAVADPRLASDGSDVPGVVPLSDGSLAAHWTVKRDGAPYARDVAVAVSRDGGGTWSRPASPHHDGTPSPRGMATLLARAASGRFGITWLDGRAGALSDYGEGGTALYWADWNGTGFDHEIELDPRVCDCCKTAAALAPSGPVVAYRDREDGERRDTSLVREERGAWSTPATVHADGWAISACPTNGPAISTRGDRTAIAWFTAVNAAPAVWVVASDDGGRSLGAPVRVDGGAPSGRVDVSILPDGSAAVVWLEKRGATGEIRARRVPASGVAADAVVVAETSAARASGYPRVLATGEREALVAWTAAGSPGGVRAAVVTLP